MNRNLFSVIASVKKKKKKKKAGSVGRWETPEIPHGDALDW